MAAKLVLGMVLLLFSGCFWSVPVASTADTARARTLAPTERCGLVYAFVPDPKVEGAGGFFQAEVLVDGRTLGHVSDDTFVYVYLRPGRHVLVTRFHRRHGPPFDRRPLSFAVNAGQRTYLHIRPDDDGVGDAESMEHRDLSPLYLDADECLRDGVESSGAG